MSWLAPGSRAKSETALPPTKSRRKPSSKTLTFWVAGGLLVLLLAALGMVRYVLPYLDPMRLPYDQWRTFTRLFLAPDGRIFDTGNGGVSHSEGQGYGMLFAEAFADRATFDLIWQWTRKNLQAREDALLAWRWTPKADGNGGEADLNNASDGDILVAWALYRAFLRWRDPEYALAAAQILADLRSAAIVPSQIGMVLLPAEHGFVHGSQVTLNPSYFIFPALADLSNLIFRKEMSALGRTGKEICQRARFGAFALVPDWVLLQGKAFSLPQDPALPAAFGYNAIRVPLQIAWHDPRSEMLASFVEFWKNAGAEGELSAKLALPDDVPGPDPALPGMLAIIEFVTACQENRPFLPAQVPPIGREEVYYSAALKMLTLLAARDVMLQAKMQLTPDG